jgi:adenine-specific DNA-methyltransferase
MKTIVLHKEYKAEQLARKKELGQFFTPAPIARFMAQWILQPGESKKILDPATGMGIFIKSILEISENAKIDAFDIDEHILTICGDSIKMLAGRDNVTLCCKDYMASNWGGKYDGVICNPPYMRFQDYDNKDIIIEAVKNSLKIHLSGLTNLYTLFLLKSLSELKENGRMTYIVPSEFLNSNYGEHVKQYLINEKSLRYVILFDFNSNLFEDAITTSCILLFDKKCRHRSIEFITVHGINELEDLSVKIIKDHELKIGTKVPFSQMEAPRKWRAYYQKTNSHKYHNLIPLTRIGNVSRGIATGSNNYFTFSKEKIDLYKMPYENLLPCITKSAHANELFFDEKDFEKLVEKNKRAYLLDAVGTRNENVEKYLQLGEKKGIHKKYLTSHRNPWYAQENRPPAPIWAGVFNRKGLKFVRNEAGIRNLTTFHCFYLNMFYHVKANLIFAYLITNIAREVFQDNRREYGGGLQKFEPNDINDSKVIDFNLIDEKKEEKILNILSCIKKSDIDRKQTTQKYIKQLDVIFREIAL